MRVAAVVRTGKRLRASGGSISRYSVSRSRQMAMMAEEAARETVKRPRSCIARAAGATGTGCSGTRKRPGRPGIESGDSASGGERIDGGLSRLVIKARIIVMKACHMMSCGGGRVKVGITPRHITTMRLTRHAHRSSRLKMAHKAPRHTIPIPVAEAVRSRRKAAGSRS